MPQIAANGLTFEYESFGRESDPALLLIMGFAAQLTGWPLALCEGLAERGFRVIRFDNRDIGKSTHLTHLGVPDISAAMTRMLSGETVEAPYSLDDMAKDAVSLLKALDIPSAHIVGASMGGMIAQLVALNHPAKARSLVQIFSTTGDPSLPRSSPEAQEALMARAPSTKREDIIAHSLKGRRTYASTRFAFDAERLSKLIGASYDRSFYPQGTLRQWAAIVASPPRTDRLKQLRIPALVMHGTADTLIPCAAGRHTAECIPGAEYHEIEGWGHDIPLGVIPELRDLIVPFVTRVEEMREDGFSIPMQPGCCGVNPQ